MINNRQNGRRGRGRNGVRPPNGGGGGGPRTDQGNRIDNRSRGNASQLLEKYKTLARDAQMQGDRVMTEFYLQFADHYFRVLSEGQRRFDEQRPARQDGYGQPYQDDDCDDGSDGNADDGFDAPHAAQPRRDEARGNEGRQNEGRPYEGRQNEGRQNEGRQNDGRPNEVRQNEGRQQGEPRQNETRGNEPRRDQAPRDQGSRDQGPREDGRQRYAQERGDRPERQDRGDRPERQPRQPYEPRADAPRGETPRAEPVRAEEPRADAPVRRDAQPELGYEAPAEIARPRRGRPPKVRPEAVGMAANGNLAKPDERFDMAVLPPSIAPAAPVAAAEGEEEAPRRRRVRRARTETGGENDASGDVAA